MLANKARTTLKFLLEVAVIYLGALKKLPGCQWLL